MCHAIIAGVDAVEVNKGDNLKVNLNLNQPQKHITYLVRDVLHLCMWAFVDMFECVCCLKTDL